MGRLSEEGWTLVTTSQVVGETFTLMRSRRLGTRAALGFLETIRGTPSIRRVHIPADWEVAAEELLAQYDDQDFSYVDATSFVAMRRLRLTTAFAFDDHFVIAGFRLFSASA